MRLSLLVGPLVLLVACGSPTEVPSTNPPVVGGPGGVGGGGGGGGGGGTTNTGTVAGDFGFTVKSAVVIPEDGMTALLFEDAQAAGLFCSGREAELTGKVAIAGVVTGNEDLTGTYDVPSAATLRISTLVAGGSFTVIAQATTGSVTVSSGNYFTGMKGSFTGADLVDANGTPLVGEVTGSFDVQRCAPRPYFDGGNAANHVSGSLGFAVQTSQLSPESTELRYVVIQADKDIGDALCADSAPTETVTFVYIALPLTVANSPVGTYTYDQANASEFSVGTYTPTNDATYESGTLQSATVKVTEGGAGRAVGTYEAIIESPQGARETLSGAFDVSACP